MKAIIYVFISILIMSVSSTSSAQPPHPIQQVQHANVLFQPQMHVNQPLNISIIQGNRVLNQRNVAVNNFTLPTTQNLAVFERGNRIKKLPDDFPIGNVINRNVNKYILPETYIGRLTNGTTAFFEILLICQSNLTINNDRSRLNGQLALQLVNSQNSSGTTETLNDPINLRVLSGSLDSLNPNDIQLRKTNSIFIINCSGRKQVVDSAEINIVTTIKQGGYKFYLPVEPFLEMNIGKNAIQGFGIQEANIFVTYLGSSKKDSILVSLDATKGTVKPSSQFVKLNEPKEFKLRSEGSQSSDITLTSKYPTLKKSIDYVFPWLYIILPLIGGIIGSFAKTYESANPVKLGKLVAGALLGLSGAVAWYALGINLSGIEWNAGLNEAAATGIGIIMTLIGVKK